MSRLLLQFVPNIGTKQFKSAILVQFHMTYLQKKVLQKTLQQYKLCGIEYLDDINFTKLDKNIKKLPNSFVKLEEFVKNCSLCSLSKEKISCGFGKGNYSSEIFVIDTNQYSHSSEAVYDMLKNMFEKVLLLDMDDIFLTNVLKCSVKTLPKDLDEQTEFCLDYLKKQISIAKPKLILTLGESFNILLNKNEAITDISGNMYRYNNIKTIPLLHPKFLIKNPSFKQQAFNDLKKTKLILEKI